MAYIGYVQESSSNLEHDMLTLRQAGCRMIIKEKQSNNDYPKDFLNPGDVLVIVSFKSLHRPIKQYPSFMRHLHGAGISFKSIQDNIDTRNVSIGIIISIIEAVIGADQQFRSEKTKGGLAIAKAQGRVGGRPDVHADALKAEAVKMYQSGSESLSKVAASFGMSRMTLYRYMKHHHV